MPSTLVTPDTPTTKTAPSLIIRGNGPWHRWLTQFARERRIPITAIVDVALREYAKAEGYEEPPQRTKWR